MDKKRVVRYIVVEGIDGSGKTTFTKYLRSALLSFGERAEIVKEPHHPIIETLIREVYNGNYGNQEEILALLFASDRLMLKDHILELLKRGYWVLSDRSKYSSYAYQKADMSFLYKINSYMLEPDFIFYLRANVEYVMKNLNEDNIYEDVEELLRVSQWYERTLVNQAKLNNVKVFTIDVNENVIFKEIALEIAEKLVMEESK